MRNPFVVGREIKYKEPFCNRGSEIKKLMARAKSSESVCIISLRRYGKSSLLNQVMGKLREEGWVTLKIDLMNVHSIEDFCFFIGQEIRKFQSIKNKIFSAIKHIKPSITIGVDPLTSLPSFGVGLNSSVSKKEAILREILNTCLKLPKLLSKPVLLVFDELQQVRKIAPKGEIEAVMRAVFEKRDYDCVPFYLGSRRSILKFMFQKESEPFFKSATVMEIKELPAKSYVEFVQNEFKKTLSLTPSEAILHTTWELFQGHPYAVAKLANRLWFRFLENPPKSEEGQERLWLEVMTEIIEEEGTFYEAINKDLPSYVMVVFRKIAEEGVVEKPYQEKFLNKVGMTAAKIQKALGMLKKNDKIERDKKGIYILDPLEKLWLFTSRMNEEQIKTTLIRMLKEKDNNSRC